MENSLIVAQGTAEIQSAEQTFWAVVEEWLAALREKDKKERTIGTYRYNMGVFKSWLDFEGISQVTRRDIVNWKEDMKEKGLSVSTRNLYLATVRSFYKWLADEHAVDNIAIGIEGGKITREHKRGFLSTEEMKRLLAVVEPETERRLAELKIKSKNNCNRIKLQGKRDKAILAALLTGGLRTIEISRLRIADLIHNGGVCYLNVWGKGREAGETETVKISPKTESVIREWLNAREVVSLVSDESPLFCSLGNNSFGEPITSLSVSRLCKEYLRAAGLKEKDYKEIGGKKKTKPITAHSLRGSCATNAFNNGATLDQVKQQLRHANITTTMIYLEEAQKSKNPVSDLIADKIF